MPSTIIDFHVHAFPDATPFLSGRLPDPLKEAFSRILPLGPIRRQARNWTKSISHSFHHLQTFLRYLPDPIREGMDELAGLVPLPHLLFESTLRDLLEEMDLHGVNQALVIADPGWSSSDLILKSSESEPRLMAAVSIPPRDPKGLLRLESFVARGARALSIHPSADHEEPGSPCYRNLIAAASELGIPVILHSGTSHPHLVLRSMAGSDARTFQPWFREFPKARFVLAHMNGHDPDGAIDLAVENPNVYVDISGQPTEVIGEAVRGMGAERVLFASDWPILGDNLAVGLERIRDGVEAELLTPDQARRILGENARELLGLKDPDHRK